eukprot:Hpha_TRINITY_DN15036_c1_g12::TRINITY_DN15036_c1_g12_i1::g.123318::m.123318
MVRFGDYLAHAQQHKPQWSKAFLDYRRLVGILEGDEPITSVLSGIMVNVHPRPSSAMSSVSGSQVPVRSSEPEQAPGTFLLEPPVAEVTRVHSTDSLDLVCKNFEGDEEIVSVDVHTPRGGQEGVSPASKHTSRGGRSPGVRRRQNRDRAINASGLRQEPECCNGGVYDDEVPDCGDDFMGCVKSDHESAPLVHTESYEGRRSRAHTVTTVDVDFCTAFREEFEKVLRFYHRALHCFRDFFLVKRPKWERRADQEGEGARNRVKRCVEDLYSEISHLVQFVDVNIVAIHKILKKAKKHLPEDEYIRPNSVVGPGEKRLNKGEADELKKQIEAFYCQEFTNGNMHEAVRLLNSGPQLGFPLFLIGLLLGLVIAGILYGMHVTLELDVPAEDQTKWWRTFPCFRLFFFIALCSVFWSGCLYMYKLHRINHAYILELDTTKRQLQWFHCLAMGLIKCLVWVWLADLYIRSGVHAKYYYKGFDNFQSWCLPLVIVGFVFALGLHPKSFKMVMSTALNVVVLPYPRSVRFRDFFVADWMTSLTLPIGDIEFFGCYIVQSIAYGSAAERHTDCTPDNKKFKYFLTILPFLWRLCQCLHMLRRTKKKAHMVNAGKYVCLASSDFFSLMFLASDGDPGGAHWWRFWASMVAKTYAFCWDICMDWGFAGHLGIPGYKKRHTQFSWFTYGAAAFYNLMARFAFSWNYIPGFAAHNHFVVTGLGVLELSRRALWSVFRVENENVNNLEKYRSVDYVPEVDAKDYGE